MLNLIHRSDLPEEFINWIPPEKLEEVFSRAGEREIDCSELLLENASTAIYHFDPANFCSLGIEPLLLGVNYHLGHS